MLVVRIISSISRSPFFVSDRFCINGCGKICGGCERAAPMKFRESMKGMIMKKIAIACLLGIGLIIAGCSDSNEKAKKAADEAKAAAEKAEAAAKDAAGAAIDASKTMTDSAKKQLEAAGTDLKEGAAKMDAAANKAMEDAKKMMDKK